MGREIFGAQVLSMPHLANFSKEIIKPVVSEDCDGMSDDGMPLVI